MPQVNVRDCPSFEVALRRLKRMCDKAGIPSRQRYLESYEKPTTKRKRKAAAAVKRWKKLLSKQQETLERNRTKH